MIFRKCNYSFPDYMYTIIHHDYISLLIFQFEQLDQHIIEYPDGEVIIQQLNEDKYLIPKNRKAFVKICTEILVKVSVEGQEKK